MLVILRQRPASGPVRYRVLDLRTPTAFADENGKRLEAVASEGPLMLRCGSFALLLFPTGGPGGPWPEDAGAAWERIPPRLYQECEPADPDRWLVPAGRPEPLPAESRAAWAHATTRVSTFPGPVFPSRGLEGAGAARGELRVSSEFGRVSLQLGKASARRGMLLGRYERCDTAGLPVLSAGELSRVHVFVVELGGVLYAVDTASKNGTWVGSRRIRSVRIEPGLRLRLADHATREWRFFH